MFNIFFYENLTFYEVMWEKVVRHRQATDDDIILDGKDPLCMPDN